MCACQQAAHVDTTVFAPVFQSVRSLYYSLKIVLQNYLQTYSRVSIPWETFKCLQALRVASRCYKWMSLAIHRGPVPGTHVATRTYGCSSPLATGWCVSLFVSFRSSLGHLKYLIRVWRYGSLSWTMRPRAQFLRTA